MAEGPVQLRRERQRGHSDTPHRMLTPIHLPAPARRLPQRQHSIPRIHHQRGRHTLIVNVNNRQEPRHRTPTPIPQRRRSIRRTRHHQHVRLARTRITLSHRQERARMDRRRLLRLRQLHPQIVLEHDLIHTERVVRTRRRHEPLEHRPVRESIHALSGPSQHVLELVNDLRRNSNTEITERLLTLVVDRPQHVTGPLLRIHPHQPRQQITLSMRKRRIRARNHNIEHQSITTFPPSGRTLAAPNFTTP